jgi:2-keto-4-pentenoate hydratase/2-oxohepta-3-ene-1,7-dioic acid hydratase in catechol pathway
MRLCTLRGADGSNGEPALFVPGRGVIPIHRLAGIEPPLGDNDLMAYVAEFDMLFQSAADAPDDAFLPLPASFAAPYRRPRKILGIGLNYRAHAGDLGEDAPRSSPASFFKADHTIIGPGEAILIPPNIGRVTAEAELALVIGRECHHVDVDEAMSYVTAVTAVLDQTAEEVLLQNPRYLTRVKNYPTFFSFGPFLISMDEIKDSVGDIGELVVSTERNGAVHRSDVVANMTFSPAELVSFHSHVMPLYPGDIISTGTPGAVPIEPGDVITCRLGDLVTLTNPVQLA